MVRPHSRTNEQSTAVMVSLPRFAVTLRPATLSSITNAGCRPQTNEGANVLLVPQPSSCSVVHSISDSECAVQCVSRSQLSALSSTAFVSSYCPLTACCTFGAKHFVRRWKRRRRWRTLIAAVSAWRQASRRGTRMMMMTMTKWRICRSNKTTMTMTRTLCVQQTAANPSQHHPIQAPAPTPVFYNSLPMTSHAVRDSVRRYHHISCALSHAPSNPRMRTSRRSQLNGRPPGRSLLVRYRCEGIPSDSRWFPRALLLANYLAMCWRVEISTLFTPLHPRRILGKSGIRIRVQSVEIPKRRD